MGLHILCPCCGTEIAVPENVDIKKAINDMPKDGTFFLMPKNGFGNNFPDIISDIKRRAGKNDIVMERDMDFESNTAFDGNYRDTDFDRFPVNNDIDNENIDDTDDVEDDIEDMIEDSGYVNNGHLYRRWITAQMLRSFFNQDTDKTKRRIENFNRKFITETPYVYQWQVLQGEYRAIGAQLNDIDPEAKRRLKFYNDFIILDMIKDYKSKFNTYLDKRLKYTNKRILFKMPKSKSLDGCKHETVIPYTNIPYFNVRKLKNVFGMGSFINILETYHPVKNISDYTQIYVTTETKMNYMKKFNVGEIVNLSKAISKTQQELHTGIYYKNALFLSINTIKTVIAKRCDKFIEEIQEMKNSINGVPNGTYFHNLSEYAAEFRQCIPINLKLTKTQSWTAAFKKTGAYYTLENLLKYHDCNLYVVDEDAYKRGEDTIDEYTGTKALKMLDELVDKLNDYQLFAVLRLTVEKNDLESKIRNKELW